MHLLAADALMPGPSASTPSLHLLIVDDHTPSAYAMAFALRRRGHLCRCVNSPLRALDATRESWPDVAVIEWILGRGAGSGLARQLRAIAHARERTLVVVAVSTQDEPLGFCEREGFDAYFVKPIDMDAFDARLTRLTKSAAK
jgi:DNA-binding response OmpR family regulator